MRVSMDFLHLELTFTPHYIITDKGLLYVNKKATVTGLQIVRVMSLQLLFLLVIFESNNPI